MHRKLRVDLLEKYYSQHKAPHTLYKESIQSLAAPHQKILDFGAGRGDSSWIYPEYELQIFGVDVGESVLQNPRLQEAKLLESENIPYPDGFFDLVIATWVLEHLPNPPKSFAEIQRVLAPGGKFVFITPNLFHYATFVARFTPHRFHRFFMNRFLSREADEVYPTVYRANRPDQLRKLSQMAGFRSVDVQLAEPPPLYLGFSTPTFYLGMGLERVLSKFETLAGLRQSIIGVMSK